MRLLHYTPAPFQFDPGKQYVDDEHWKPKGLWLSVEGKQDWRAWCESESFGDLTHASEVSLKPDANVLVIDSVEKLDAFNRLYGNSDALSCRSIAWQKVKATHAGVIIAPYQWERRFDFMWYYGWDCASGVIWNLSAVETVTPMVPQAA